MLNNRNYQKEAIIYQRKGHKLTQSRYNAVLHSSLELSSKWATRLFQVSIPTIELDMIPNKALTKIGLKFGGADPATNDDTTSKKHISTGDRTLRTCGVNAQVIAFALLSDMTHHRLLSILSHIAKPILPYYTDTYANQKDVKSSQAWLIKQLQGGMMQHVLNFFLQLVMPP